MAETCVKCYSPGTDVKLWGDIAAKVLDIMVSDGNKLSYRVAWMDGKARRCEWVEPSEVEADDYTCSRTKIGFCTADAS